MELGQTDSFTAMDSVTNKKYVIKFTRDNKEVRMFHCNDVNIYKAIARVEKDAEVQGWHGRITEVKEIRPKFLPG